MKLISALIAIGLAGSAFGQIADTEMAIQDAFVSLRQDAEVMFTLDGTDVLGNRTNVLYSNAFFYWDPGGPDKFAKAEINDYVNAAHTHRIVADGTTVWGYDFGGNSYTSFRYGIHTGSLPAGFRTNMLQEMTTASQSQTTFLARLMREVYSGDNAMYRTWLPMAAVTTVVKNGNPSSLQDPVSQNRVYVGDDLNYYIVYTYATRLKRSSAFHFTRKDISTPWELSEIFYADQQATRSGLHTVDWKITLYRGALPSSTNYVFQPPSNARPIANVRSVGG